MLLLPVFRDDGDMFLSLSGMADTCCCCLCLGMMETCSCPCLGWQTHVVVACV